MARGITENDVHQAADALVAGSERPTVDRIRSHLGTGSPNTVTRWLETWWQGLGNRLEAQQRKLATPEAPEAVATLAGEWWALALSHARTAVDNALAADRDVLQGRMEALQQDREAFANEAAALRDEVSTSAHARQVAAAQAAELQRLASRLEGQLEETTRQRDAAAARVADADSASQALEARIRALQDAAQVERESLNQHVRTVEDRAYTEIDRARQEAKELRAQLTSVSRQAAAAEKALLERLEQANMKATEAGQEAGAQRARADALEGHLAGLKDLPAAVEAAMRQAATRTSSNRATSTAGRPKQRVRRAKPVE